MVDKEGSNKDRQIWLEMEVLRVEKKKVSKKFI
jgi:hypothetical protein